MTFSISPVQADNVDPLYRMNHDVSTVTAGAVLEAGREDEIRWAINGLLEAVHAGDEALYEICGLDGSPVGLIGWTTSLGASGAGQKTSTKSKSSWTPPSLDVASWLDISKRLREEKQSVFETYQGSGICRESGHFLTRHFCSY